MYSQLTTAIVALCSSGLTAAAVQSPTPLVETGDLVPGVGLVTRIDDVSVNSLGDWIVEADTDNAVAANDVVILENGVVKFQEGTSLGIPASVAAVLSSGDRMSFNDNGEAMYLLRTRLNVGGSRGIVLFDDLLILEEDVTPFAAAGAPAGAIWDSIAETWVNTNRQMMVGGRLSTGQDVLAVVTFDATGAITGESILAIDNMALPGHNAGIQGFSYSRRRQSINDSGQTLWFVDDNQVDFMGNSNICCDSWIYMNAMPILHESDPVPQTGQIVGTLSSCEIDLNDAGDWVCQMAQNPSTFNEDIIYLNGTTIIAAEGAGLPSLPAGTVITSLGSTTGVFLTNGGDVVFHADWDDTNTDIDTGIFVNQELFVQEGVSTVGGTIIDAIATSDNTLEVSRDGSYMIVEMTLDDGTQGAYLYDLNPTIGTSYCGPAVANSSGVGAEIVGLGSSVASDNLLTLEVTELPASSFGFFITSQTQGFAMNPNGSQGNLCLGGAIGRYVGTGQIQNSGTAGEFSLVLDLTMTPQPTMTVSVAAGETWNYQAWYRDAVMGMPTSNFSDGVSVMYQ